MISSKGILPQTDLYRAVGVAPVSMGEARGRGGLRTAAQGDGRTLQLQWSVSDVWTEIASWYEGNFMERIAPGAARKTIAENRAGMRILLEHGFDPQLGSKPIAPVDLVTENELGGYAEGRLFDGVPELVVDGIRARQYGASFRFEVARDEFVHNPEPSDYNPKGLPERTIFEMRVSEFGPVTWGAYSDASAGVRSITDAMRKLAGRPPSRRQSASKSKPRSAAKATPTVSKATTRLKGELPRADWIMSDDGTPPAGEAVELRNARSPITVTLTHGARADILSDAEVTPGHERGAFAIGTHTAGTIDVRLANTTNIASRSGTGALAMAYGYELNWVRRQREVHGPHLSLVSSWHSHPTGDLIPSDADLREWSRMMLAGREFGPAPTHAGLIVDPTRGKIAAWVVRRNPHWPNNLVCERAEVKR